MHWSFWLVMGLSLFGTSVLIFELRGFVPGAFIIGTIELAGTAMSAINQSVLFVVLGIVVTVLHTKHWYGKIFDYRTAVFDAVVAMCFLGMFAVFGLLTWAVMGIVLPANIAMYVGLFGMPAFWGTAALICRIQNPLDDVV